MIIAFIDSWEHPLKKGIIEKINLYYLDIWLTNKVSTVIKLIKELGIHSQRK